MGWQVTSSGLLKATEKPLGYPTQEVPSLMELEGWSFQAAYLMSNRSSKAMKIPVGGEPGLDGGREAGTSGRLGDGVPARAREEQAPN